MIFLLASIDSCVSGSWSLNSVMENRGGVTALGCPRWLILRGLNGGGDPGSARNHKDLHSAMLSASGYIYGFAL